MFVTARFRTGSTMLWNLFRHVEGCTAYYEPLNERRWFDPSTRGPRMDATHIGVDAYWREYEGFGDLARLYDERWIDRDLLMDEHADAPALEAYIAALVGRARGRAVLQFNRVDFRLPWLRQRFPEARIVHLYRHPRDQWYSSLVTPSAVRRTVSVDEFKPLDGFYLLRWAEDLSYAFPFLRPDRAAHPYELFYMIWRLSYAFGRAYADLSVAFEALASRPAVEISRLMAGCGIAVPDTSVLARLIVPPTVGKWRAWADDEWFAEREAASDAVMGAFFARPSLPHPWPVVPPSAVESKAVSSQARNFV